MQEMSFAKRRLWLRVLSNYLLFNQNELCEVSCQDTGKTMLDASLGEILPTLEKCRWLLKEGEGTLKPSMRRTGPMMVHKSAYVEYIPLGVIVAISPWNYPLHNMFNPALAAIFSGNSIIIKPSEETLYSSLHYIRILRRALSLCGLPVDAVQIVLGGPEVGEKLVSSHVDKIFFTGSTKVGLSVAQSAAKKLTPLCLELGGKDAFAVCDDAEIGHAVNICLRGVFQNAGQNCIGVERVFVHEKVKERFVGMVVDVVKRMRCGVDTGAMTMCERGIAHVDELVQDAVSKGAKVLVGGKKAERAGFYYEPTVLDGVTGDMRIAQEEVFGPVLSLLSFSSDTQLVQMVNDCPFGLGSSIFTSSPRRASKIMSGLRVGMSNVNDFGTNYLCQSMPFGGTKMSGSDRFAGIEGLRGCCLMRSVTWNRWGFMKTRIPKGMKYPTGANCFELAREINDLMYGEGWFSKMDNLRNMVGMLIFGGWKPRTVGSG